MGIFDRFKGKADDLKDKATGVVDDKGEQIGEGLDKAGDVADDKTGGKFSDKIDQGVDTTKDKLDALDGQNDDIPDTPTKPA